ncbi:MAG: head maturation protease, ClpP-related [Acutalibacteraceae bacterium]
MIIGVKKPFYAMQMNDNNDAEITMYGEIVETQPIDWWTGEPIPGNFIIQDEFLTDLNNLVQNGIRNLTLRMDSVGGNANVAIVIHNRLRELASNGANLTCIVDGVAMSGGSLIMCACDNVKVNPSSLVMIHKCWSYIYGSYNADELRELAKSYDAWDKAQISIYERKTKLSKTVIEHMMSDTTYLTGSEAIEKGFANELIEDAEPLDLAANANRTSLFVKGKEIHLCAGMKVPDSIPIRQVSSAVEAVDIKKTQPEPDTGNDEGGIQTMAGNLEELRAENPELATQVENDVRASLESEMNGRVNSAVENERQRLQQIDEISSLYTDEQVREAKYGEKACSAQELAFRAAQQAAKNGSAFMANATADTNDSGANEVPAASGEGKEEPTTEEGKQAYYDSFFAAAVKEDK